MAFVRKKINFEMEVSEEFKYITDPASLIEYAEKNSIETSPIDLPMLCDLLKIDLIFERMESQESGYVKYNSSKKIWKMAVNTFHHPTRQRYTIGHELGHIILHGTTQKIFKDKVFFRNGESNRIEIEANDFAAKLLMPKYEFERFIKDEHSDISKISKHFGVSSLAVRYRAKNLGYQGHNV